MNLIRRTMMRLALKGADMSLLEPADWQWIGGGPTWSKVSVDEKTQLQIAAAFSCIRLISETVGTLPLKLYRKTSKGREQAVDHAAHRLVSRQPNEYMTAVEWKESMAVSLCTLGQAYNRAIRRPDGKLYSIIPVPKSKVKPELTSDGSLLYLFTRNDGQQIPLKREEICPIRGFGNVGEIEGFAPHRLHANSLALTVAVEKYGAEFFGSGGRPTGVLTTDLEFRKDQRDGIRDGFNKYVRESWLSGLLPILEKGLKYQPVTTPNNEAQFIETRKLQIAEVARIYRVPVSMLMEMDKASYNNSEQANKHFLDYTLLPYLVRIEQGLNTCLLTEKEQIDHYFEFDVRGLLRGDSTQRASYYVQMRMAGAMSQNEIRELENMPTRDGADDLHVPLNMAPSDLLREIQLDKAGASKNGPN
ncbi:phage portal protein [Azonexus sp. IMCC34839]|uniref:phage portal protein n=1 Tax=Azonexus sp. IMCC34839 TaxID=3133695 RepID=UPI00399A58F3